MRSLWFAAAISVLALSTARAEDLTLCNQGHAAKNAGDVRLAIKLYGLCIDHGKLRTEALAKAYFGRGAAHQRMGATAKAVEDYSATLRTRFDMMEAYVSRAIAYAQMGQHGLAIVDYERAIRAYPTSANLYYNRALSYIANSDYDQALRDLDKALEVDPRFPGAVHYNRGVVFTRLRLYEQAGKAFEDSIQRRFLLAIAYYDRGLLLIQNQKFDMAIADFNNALVLRPNFGDAFAYRAFCREKLGDIMGAVGDYRKSVEFGSPLEWPRKRLVSLQPQGR